VYSPVRLPETEQRWCSTSNDFYRIDGEVRGDNLKIHSSTFRQEIGKQRRATPAPVIQNV
jgi:hypothetical protein